MNAEVGLSALLTEVVSTAAHYSRFIAKQSVFVLFVGG